MIDTHCHLDAREFDTDRDAVVAAAREAGVTTLILPSVEVSGFPAVRACCQRYPGCHPAYGIHPLYVGAAREDDLYTLRQWLRDEISGEHPPVAVGEIGLDFFVPGHDASRQEQFFIEQLRCLHACATARSGVASPTPSTVAASRRRPSLISASSSVSAGP